MFRSLLLTGVFCFALASCTVDGTPPPTTLPATTLPPSSTTTTTLGPSESVEAFAACLDRAGVSLAAPLLGDVQADLTAIASGLDTADPAVRAAVVSCSPLLTAAQARQLNSDPEVRALVAAQLGAFADCMRGEGVDEFPDPADAPIPAFDLDLVPFDDPDFESALETCANLIGSYGLDG